MFGALKRGVGLTYVRARLPRMLAASYARRPKGMDDSFMEAMRTDVDLPAGDNVSLMNEELEEFSERLTGIRDNRERLDFDVARKRRTLVRRIVERKYFKAPRAVNLLTWDAKEQMRFLHAEFAEDWTAERLADSFPVDGVEDVWKILRSKFVPRDLDELIAHDERVRRNWAALKAGGGEEGGPVHQRYQQLLDSGRLHLLNNAAGNKSLPAPPSRTFLPAKSLRLRVDPGEVAEKGSFLSIVKGYCDEKEKRLMLEAAPKKDPVKLLADNSVANKTVLVKTTKSEEFKVKKSFTYEDEALKYTRHTDTTRRTAQPTDSDSNRFSGRITSREIEKMAPAGANEGMSSLRFSSDPEANMYSEGLRPEIGRQHNLSSEGLRKNSLRFSDGSGQNQRPSLHRGSENPSNSLRFGNSGRSDNKANYRDVRANFDDLEDMTPMPVEKTLTQQRSLRTPRKNSLQFNDDSGENMHSSLRKPRITSTFSERADDQPRLKTRSRTMFDTFAAEPSDVGRQEDVSHVTPSARAQPRAVSRAATEEADGGGNTGRRRLGRQRGSGNYSRASPETALHDGSVDYGFEGTTKIPRKADRGFGGKQLADRADVERYMDDVRYEKHADGDVGETPYVYDRYRGYVHPVGREADAPGKVINVNNSGDPDTVYKKGSDYYDADGNFLFRAN